MKKYILPALLLLAMQMIARFDDMAHLKKNTIMVCPEFDFALSACTRWSQNANYYCILKENVLDVPEFNHKYPGPLGNHSTRKYGLTWCRRNGCHKDEGDYHGRFKACPGLV
eukprot:8742262-Ditylum_brightwellii.AAC.1